MKKVIFPVLLLICFHLNAQWQKLDGPYGGDIRCLVTKGSNIFAGTEYNGVYMSADNGNTWSARNSGLTNMSVHFIAVNGSRLFANAGAYLYYSDDDGLTWHTNPVHPVTGLCADAEDVFITTRENVYHSTDGGSTWQEPYGAGSSFFDNENNYLTMEGDKIFIGMKTQCFYRSLDNGQSFSFYYPDREFSRFMIHGDEIYGISPYSLYKSMDNGNTWTHSDLGLSSYPDNICYYGGRFYVGTLSDYWNQGIDGGIYVSDNGSSWALSDLEGHDVTCLAGLNNNIFAGLYPGGVYKSGNEGESWTESNQGLVLLDIVSLDVKGQDIIASTFSEGITISEDRGVTWRKSGWEELRGINCVKNVNGILWAGDEDLWRSTDNGITWDEIAWDPNIYSIENNGNRIYLHCADDFNGPGAIYKSDDYGTSWQSFNNGISCTYVNSFSVIGDKAYLCTNDGMFSSGAQSSGWTDVSGNLPTRNIYAIGGKPENLLVSCMEGLFHSSALAEWSDSGIYFNAYINRFATSDSLIFGVNGVNFYFSADGGYEWSDGWDGLPDNGEVRSILVDGQDVFATYYGYPNYSGIWKRPLSEFIPFGVTQDTVFLEPEAGNTSVMKIKSSTPWTIQAPLPDWFYPEAYTGSSSQDITITAAKTNPYDPPRFFTMNILSKGITRNVVIAQKGKVLGIREVNPVVSIYPNPSDGIINISVPDGCSGIRVSTVSGRVIKDIVPEKKSEQLDLSMFGAGIYIVNVICRNEVIVRKIIVN